MRADDVFVHQGTVLVSRNEAKMHAIPRGCGVCGYVGVCGCVGVWENEAKMQSKRGEVHARNVIAPGANVVFVKCLRIRFSLLLYTLLYFCQVFEHIQLLQQKVP